jgi:hypothetical protein
LRFSERPAAQPDDAATGKFRLILDAFKREASGDSALLTAKLRQWQLDEESPQVRRLIREALRGVEETAHELGAKAEEPLLLTAQGALTSPVTVPLAALELPAAAADRVPPPDWAGASSPPKRLRSAYLEDIDVNDRHHASDDEEGEAGDDDEGGLITVPLRSQLLQKDSGDGDGELVATDGNDLEALGERDGAFGGDKDEGGDRIYVKESLRLPLPFPAAPADVFAMLTRPGLLVLCAPRPKQGQASLTPAEVPFERVQLYDSRGDRLREGGAKANAEALREDAAEVDLEPEMGERVRRCGSLRSRRRRLHPWRATRT